MLLLVDEVCRNGDNMKKKYKQLLITILFTTIVCGTLFYMYDLFTFHTYSRRVYYDVLASVDNEVITLTNYEIFQDEVTGSYGNGTLYLKDITKLKEALPESTIGDTLNVNVNLTFMSEDNTKIEMVKNYNIVLEEGGTFVLNTEEAKNKELYYASIKKAEIQIQSNNQEVIYELKTTPMQPLQGKTKEYRLESASIHNNVLRLGKLMAEYDLTKKYDNISLEYRYMINPKGDSTDIDNYVVFDKVSGTIDEYLHTKEFGTFQYRGEEKLTDKKISVVVILSKGEKEYVFSIDMEKEDVGV